MPECLLCLKNRPSLTDEHIIPVALGSELILPKSTCDECQRLCNKSFEHRFLKGSNFIALLRAFVGIRGRRNEPIYGFDAHGNPLTIEVQPGFPPIRVGLGVQKLERPMQVILVNVDRIQEPLSYHFLPNQLQRPITKNLFESVVDEIPDGANCAAFWADGDILPVNYWRELFETFVVWCNANNLTPMSSIAAAEGAEVGLELEWNFEYRNRGLTKICFMYAMSKMNPEDRQSSSFIHSRRYILEGIPYPSYLWPSAPIVQWNGQHPGGEILGEKGFTYLLATVNLEIGLFSLIQLHNMGLFAVKLAEPENPIVCPDTLTTYLLDRSDEGRYLLHEEPSSAEEAAAFASSVGMSQQL